MTGSLASPSRSLPTVLVVGAISAMLAASALLWVYFGTAVFFEMIRAGFIACFG